MHRVKWRNISAIGLALWLTTVPGYAQESGAATGRIEEEAMSTLMRAAEILAKEQRFSVKTDIEYDVIQDWGQKLEFGARRTITVKRPDRMSVDIVDRDGSRRGFRFDGKQIAFFGLDEKVYATVEKSGDVDTALTYFTRDLQMPLPMAELWSNDLPQALKDRISEASVIAEETVRGTLCDHIAVRNDMTDAQIWVTKGAKPLLHRFVITYKHANGQPEFRADFLDWNLSAETLDSLFAFTPAEGANRIQFVAGMDPDAGRK